MFTREVTLQVDHAFRRWLIATGKFVYGNDDYIGSDRDDNRYSASAALTYKLTRELWLKTEYRHDWLRSSVSGQQLRRGRRSCSRCARSGEARRRVVEPNGRARSHGAWPSQTVA